MDTPAPELPAEVVAAIHAGRKIDAIKQLRAEHNIGLKEAKEIVDAYIEGHPGLEKTRGPKTETGLGRLVLIGVVIAVLYFLYRNLS